MQILRTYVEREVWRHKDAFKGCRVLVLGEDKSGAFTSYICRRFGLFEIKTLTCVTCTNPQTNLFETSGTNVLSEYDGVTWKDEEIESTCHFQSEYIQSILDNYDFFLCIPDFTELHTYVSVLMRKGKKFIILGHLLNYLHRSIFPYVQSGDVHFGFTLRGEYVGFMEDFDKEIPDWNRRERLLSGKDVVRLQNLRWYCNTGIKKYCHPFKYYYVYTDEKFEKFDNCDALNVPDYRNIPLDYRGVVGTSPMILDVLRFDEFKILHTHAGIPFGLKYKGKTLTYRIFVQRV